MVRGARLATPEAVRTVSQVATVDAWDAAGDERGAGMSEHRRPGRRPLSDTEGSTFVSVTVTNSDYDRAYRLARQNGVTVPAVFRHAFHRLLATNRRDDEAGKDL